MQSKLTRFVAAGNQMAIKRVMGAQNCRFFAHPLSSRIDSEIASHKCLVYAKSYCPHCAKTRALFKEGNVEVKYFELDLIDDGADVQEALKEKTGQKTVPNVFIGGQHIGGNSDVQALHQKGELAQKLTAAGIDHKL